MSQFHYGSITTTQYRTESGVEIDGLNSTMVRLQLFLKVGSIYDYKLGLNSTMVRLQR